MISRVPQTKKLIEKYKKIVYKQYPKAYASKMGSGYTIVQDSDELAQTDILAEFCFAPQKDLLQAWELASSVTKTNQNLLRTHPYRTEGMYLEDKLERAAVRRMNKGEETAAKRKRSYIDIY